MGARAVKLDDPFRVGQVNAKGRPICGAKRRGLDLACQLPPAAGRDRCRRHGGMSPVGPASPQYKHGRFSNVLPARYHAAYHGSIDNPRAASLRHELGLLEAREAELLAALSTNETVDTWRDLADAWSDYRAAADAKDLTAASAALRRVNTLVGTGSATAASNAATWAALLRVFNTKRGVSESERKYEIERGKIVQQAEAQRLVGMLLDVIRQEIDDRATLSRIAVAFGRAALAITGDG